MITSCHLPTMVMCLGGCDGMGGVALVRKKQKDKILKRLGNFNLGQKYSWPNSSEEGHVFDPGTWFSMSKHF